MIGLCRVSNFVLYGCLPLRWSGSGSVIRDHSDHGSSNEPMTPCPEWIHRLIWSTMSDLGSLILIPDHLKGTNSIILLWLDFWSHVFFSSSPSPSASIISLSLLQDVWNISFPVYFDLLLLLLLFWSHFTSHVIRWRTAQVDKWFVVVAWLL